jgi:hypothetical protein
VGLNSIRFAEKCTTGRAVVTKPELGIKEFSRLAIPCYFARNTPPVIGPREATRMGPSSRVQMCSSGKPTTTLVTFQL